MYDGWVDPSPIGKCRRELERLVAIPEAYHQMYGVAWALGVIRCTTPEEEIAAARERAAT